MRRTRDEPERSNAVDRELAEELHCGHRDRLREEVQEGLSSPTKRLPSKLFYDRRGSRLFDEICELPEYYLTRTETAILAAKAERIADQVGPGTAVIEMGAGSCVKVRYLLDAFEDVAAFVPVDVSGPHLEAAAAEIAAQYPSTEVIAVGADFTQAIELPELPGSVQRRVLFFPGSTIGNFDRDAARELLGRFRALAGPDGALVLGVDLVKDSSRIEAAYNDARGVTARFNRNILRVVNRELDADFDPEAFEHHAHYDEEQRRIEMRLLSRAAQTVRVADREYRFAPGEILLTEYSHKYSLEDFAALCADAGLAVGEVYTDEERLFSVQVLLPEEAEEA